MSHNKNISKKQICINMLANTISYSSNLIISFIITPFLIDSLGKDIYSFYPIANNIVTYLSILTGALNTIASRFFTVELVRGDEKEAKKYFSSVLASNVIISVIMLIPMLIIIIFIDKLLNVPINSLAAIRALFAFVFSAALVNVIGSIYGIATFAKNRIDLRSLREIITAVVRLVLYFVLYKFFPATIVYTGLVALIVAVISLSIQFYYTKILLPGVNFDKNFISIRHTKELIFATSWNIIFSFGNTLLAGMNLVLINVLYSADASGSLSIVQTVPSFINGVISMLVGVFFPVITYKIAENDIKGVTNQIITAQHIMAIIGGAVIVVFSGMAREFFQLWVPKENSLELSKLSFITIFPHLIISCTWIISNLNVAMNKVKKPAIFTLLLGVINILFAIIAARLFNAPFECIQIISSALQVLWVGVYMPVYASKELGISNFTFYPPIIKAVVASAISYLLTIFIKHLLCIDNWVTFIIVGAIMGCVSLVIFSIIELGFRNIKDYFKLIYLKVHR